MGGFRRVLVVFVVVAVFGGVLGGASAAAQDVERPGRGERLDNVIVTAGETIEVDISVGFTGAVETYSATSGDATVATVSVSGSVVSITSVSAGYAYAFVTVTATNAGGSRSQWFEVTVTPPPAPTLRYQLAAQATTIDAVVASDLTPVFEGVVTSYSATSSDVTILDASVDESILVLRGVAAGAVTATVTAHNGPGSASVTFPVTVGAFAPPQVTAPQTAGALDAQDVPVGATTTIDVTGAFAGTMDDYVPITSDDAIVTATRPHLGTIELTGVAAGTATVRIVAINTGGIAAQTLDVTVTEPVLPTITATAPTHCLTGEGTPTATGGREGIATIDIAYEVTGGIEPYVITNDANSITTTAPTGTINVTCARPGVDIHNVAPTVNAVESGPKAVTLTITDNNGDTATTDVTIQIVEDAATTTENNGSGLQAGKTYVIGDPDEWTLITLPTGLDLQFFAHGVIGGKFETVHFTHAPTGSLLTLDWGTGAEVFRDVVAPGSNASNSSHARQTSSLDTLFDLVSRSANRPLGIANPGVEQSSTKWRPYADLLDDQMVAVQPRLMIGEPLRVCNGAKVEDFGYPFPTISGYTSAQLLSEFNDAFDDAIDLWNETMHGSTTQRRASTGTPSLVFNSIGACSSGDLMNPVGSSADIIVLKKLHRALRAASAGPAGCPLHTMTPRPAGCDDRYEDGLGRSCVSGRESSGCARRNVMGSRPPTIVSYKKNTSGGYQRFGSYAQVNASDPAHYVDQNGDDIDPGDVFRRVIAHELGHYLGLGDYGQLTPPMPGDLRACPGGMRSLYAYRNKRLGGLDCASLLSDLITARDKADIHEIYHPDALTDMRVVDEIPSFGYRPTIRKDWAITGMLPRDTGKQETTALGQVETIHQPEYNAFGYVVWSRDLALGGSWNLFGAVPLSRVATRSGHVVIVFEDHLNQLDSFNPVGMEFRVAGVTRGDLMRDAVMGQHSSKYREVPVTIDGIMGPWTIGSTDETYAKPGTPATLKAKAKDGKVLTSWSGVNSATRYELVWKDSGGTGLGMVSFLPDDLRFWVVGDLTNGDTYSFEVTAFIGTAAGVPAVATATPEVVPGPTGVAAGQATTTLIPVSWTAVSGATQHEVVALPVAAAGTTAGAADAAQTTNRDAEREQGAEPAGNLDSHSFSGLEPSTTYELSVRTFKAAGIPPLPVRVAVSDWVSVPATTDGLDPLDDPSNLSVSEGSNSLTWSWDAVTDASGYNYEWEGDGLSVSRRTSATRYSLHGISPGTTYTFRVQAVNTTTGATSNWVDLEYTTTGPPPPPPEVPDIPEFTSTSSTADSVTVNWSSESGATGYSLRRGGASGTLLVDDKSGTSFTDDDDGDGLSANTTYGYEVQAHNSAGDSGWSSVTEVTTKSTTTTQTPDVPVFTSTSSTADSVSLSWSSESGATGYSVSRDGTVILSSQNVTSHTDDDDGDDLEEGTTYRYRVKAHNAAGSSAWSGAVDVTTKITGQLSIQQMSPTPVGGWTLSLRYVDSGGSPINPLLQFTKLEDIETTWQYTSAVSATVGGQNRELGRVAYRLTSAGGERIEVGFRPTGSSTIVLPSPNRFITYSNMVIGRWYSSSSFTYALAANASAKTNDVDFAGRLANALAPGEQACENCTVTFGDLEPAKDDT